MTEPAWISTRDAILLHQRLLAIAGGLAGVRDIGLLESAIARPQQLYSYGDRVDLAALAAAYIAGIIRNHPFFDGNKRVGFVVGVLFLEMNGYLFSATEVEATKAIFECAEGKLNEDELARWIRANSEPV